MEGIVNIKVEQLYPHPDNPRKDVGDVTELAESIKKSGIMQNLTVIPITALSKEPDEQPEAEKISLKSDFHVLIGHRRLAASKMAGLSEVPCKIVSKISKKEQVAVMLEENMQRADLTIWEQAQGFQMMLDLGETEDSIAEKTGFSKTTVRHRLNIAKLDSKLLQEKEKSNTFQLTLTDLYALEQVEDIKTRNKILRESCNSRDLIWKAKSAAEEARRDKKAKQIIELLKAEGLTAAPKEVENTWYSGKWKTMESYDLDKAVPKRISKKKIEGGMYIRWYREIKIVKKKDKSAEPQTKWEKEQKEREKKTKTIKAIAKEMSAQREDFIRNIIAGKIEPLKNTEKVMSNLWNAVVY